MARKKQEIALQVEINTQEEWEELMQKDGLYVIDVYQEWCGPCKALLTFFRRMKNELGDDFLNFAVAKSDTIDSMEKYRGKCEPCFLIYGGGSLVSVIRGANPPVLEELIKEKLSEEHKIMAGEVERKEFKDPTLTDVEVEEKVEDEEFEEVEKEVTLALIKPDIVLAGKVEEIIGKLKENEIEILAQEERNLTEDEARSFYHHMSESQFFEDLIKFIASGPSYVLVLSKGDEGIIKEFRELIGPKEIEEAKENAPESLRAQYGSSSIENAIHGADDIDTAQRELAFFFPDFVKPTVTRKKVHTEDGEGADAMAQGLQRTLALIRPDAYEEFKDSILEKINAAGFQIAMKKEVKLTKEDAQLFYKGHEEKEYFEDLTEEMSKGTLLALALEKQNAVSNWRNLIGPPNVEEAKESDPNCLRAQFCKEDLKINLLHGSDSEMTAEAELRYFFPVEHTVVAIKPDGLDNREEIISKIQDARFQIAKKKDILLTKEMAEQFYEDQKDQEYYAELIEHMQSGSTLFLLLSREDAVRGWRSMMGPKDPVVANESYPDCLRSIYGKDIKANAVYGSENKEEAERVMTLIFGTLEFNEDGSLLPEYMDQPEEAEEAEETQVSESKDQEETLATEKPSEEVTFETHERIMMEAEEADATTTVVEGEETEKTKEGETTEAGGEDSEAVTSKEEVETGGGEVEGEDSVAVTSQDEVEKEGINEATTEVAGEDSEAATANVNEEDKSEETAKDGDNEAVTVEESKTAGDESVVEEQKDTSEAVEVEANVTESEEVKETTEVEVEQTEISEAKEEEDATVNDEKGTADDQTMDDASKEETKGDEGEPTSGLDGSQPHVDESEKGATDNVSIEKDSDTKAVEKNDLSENVEETPSKSHGESVEKEVAGDEPKVDDKPDKSEEKSEEKDKPEEKDKSEEKRKSEDKSKSEDKPEDKPEEKDNHKNKEVASEEPKNDEPQDSNAQPNETNETDKGEENKEEEDKDEKEVKPES